MDIKSKKTHSLLGNIKKILLVIVPAIILVCMYPYMEKLVHEEYEKNEQPEDMESYYCAVDNSFVTDALQMIKYEYGSIQQEKNLIENEILAATIMGYMSTYETAKNNIEDNGIVYQLLINENCYMSVTTEDSNDQKLQVVATQLLSGEKTEITQKERDRLGIIGYYIVEYDENGRDVVNKLYIEDEVITYREVGINGLKNNEDEMDTDDEIISYRAPSVFFDAVNTKGVFFIRYADEYVDWYENEQFISVEEAYFNIGALFLIAAVVIAVGLVAVILWKKNQNADPKKKSLYVDVAMILLGFLIMGITYMFYLMCYTNLEALNSYFSRNDVYVLGYMVTGKLIYGMLIACNIIGWSLCFAIEYAVVAASIDFVIHPIQSIKERCLVVIWCKKIASWISCKMKKISAWARETVMAMKDSTRILVIMFVNCMVAIISCFLEVMGIVVLLIYTVVVYLITCKKYVKIKSQYNTVVDTAILMGEGDLKIEITEDMGVFKPISDGLMSIKDGFSKAVAEEAKSRDMKTELITNVSHDLKTPLTAIITYVELLKKEDLSDKDRKKYIETLDMKSQRLKVLIEDLFEISKANSGNVQLNLMELDVVGLIKQVKTELEDRIEESNVNLKWSLPEHKVALKLDGQKTYRIFANLINNILKYSLKGSRAFVEVEDNSKNVKIVFKNVSENEILCDANDLTERFVRGDVSRNSEGSGLGLAIVKSFVELQGGTFHIEVDGDLFKAVIIWEK